MWNLLQTGKVASGEEVGENSITATECSGGWLYRLAVSSFGKSKRKANSGE